MDLFICLLLGTVGGIYIVVGILFGIRDIFKPPHTGDYASFGFILTGSLLLIAAGIWRYFL